MNPPHGPQSSLRILRQRAGLTHKDLAYLLGYKSDTMIAHLESGSRLPRGREIVLLELIFGLSASCIFTDVQAESRALLADRIRELKEVDRVHRNSKQIMWASLKRQRLEGVLESLRSQARPDTLVHTPCQATEATTVRSTS